MLPGQKKGLAYSVLSVSAGTPRCTSLVQEPVTRHALKFTALLVM